MGSCAGTGLLPTVMDNDASSSMPFSEAPTGLLVSSAPSDRIGGRYTLLGLLGAGGMGTVYRARDEELDEVIALKMLLPEFVDEPGMLERFRREVKLARRVTHTNVARVFDIGEHGSAKYLTMLVFPLLKPYRLETTKLFKEYLTEIQTKLQKDAEWM